MAKKKIINDSVDEWFRNLYACREDIGELFFVTMDMISYHVHMIDRTHECNECSEHVQIFLFHTFECYLHISHSIFFLFIEVPHDL